MSVICFLRLVNFWTSTTMGLLGDLPGMSQGDGDVPDYIKGGIMAVDGTSTAIIPVTVWYDYI